jgi:uncharacterized protein
MKIQLTLAEGKYIVTGYGPGWIEINKTRHETSLILTPDRLTPWAATSIKGLTENHFEPVMQLAPDVLLIGAGDRLNFPSPMLLKPLIEAGIGFEVMNTAAACRTYNVLIGDGRNVAAALIIS